MGSAAGGQRGLYQAWGVGTLGWFQTVKGKWDGNQGCKASDEQSFPSSIECCEEWDLARLGWVEVRWEQEQQ